MRRLTLPRTGRGKNYGLSCFVTIIIPPTSLQSRNAVSVCVHKLKERFPSIDHAVQKQLFRRRSRAFHAFTQRKSRFHLHVYTECIPRRTTAFYICKIFQDANNTLPVKKSIVQTVTADAAKKFLKISSRSLQAHTAYFFYRHTGIQRKKASCISLGRVGLLRIPLRPKSKELEEVTR